MMVVLWSHASVMVVGMRWGSCPVDREVVVNVPEDGEGGLSVDVFVGGHVHELGESMCLCDQKCLVGCDVFEWGAVAFGGNVFVFRCLFDLGGCESHDCEGFGVSVLESGVWGPGGGHFCSARVEGELGFVDLLFHDCESHC